MADEKNKGMAKLEFPAEAMTENQGRSHIWLTAEQSVKAEIGPGRTACAWAWVGQQCEPPTSTKAP